MLAQVIAGRDGKSAFAVVPFDYFMALVALARAGGPQTVDERLRRLRQGDWRATVERLLVGLRGKSFILERQMDALFSEEGMEKTLDEVIELLRSPRNAAAHRPKKFRDEGEEADDVAAYDAAKARNEESFPAAIADRLIAGESPLKVFREYRGSTQAELAKKAKTTAAYLSQIENGRRTGSIRLLRRLAETLRLDIDDLV